MKGTGMTLKDLTAWGVGTGLYLPPPNHLVSLPIPMISSIGWELTNDVSYT